MFPEKKLQYSNNIYQTTKINDFENMILSDNSLYRDKIKKLTSISESQPHQVIPLGLEPRTPSLKVMCSTC